MEPILKSILENKTENYLLPFFWQHGEDEATLRAMMAAIAATGCTGPVTVLGAECVQKSYPDFWEVYQSLGGDIHVL